MNSAVTALARYSKDLLPEAITLEGVRFWPNSEVWLIQSMICTDRLDFGKFGSLTEVSRRKLKIYFQWLLQHRAAGTSFVGYHNLRIFLEATEEANLGQTEKISLSRVLQYKLKLSANTEWKLAKVRTVLKQMHALGIGIASEECMEFLSTLKLQKNPTGTSIRTRDPNTGAFSDIELLEIQQAINDDYAAGKLQLYPYAMFWILLAYGVRPIQIAALKESDLKVRETPDGDFYVLRIPRAKQRSQSRRGAFKSRACSRQVGIVLQKVIERNRLRREAIGLSGEDWPMFMAANPGHLPNLQYHMQANHIAYVINRVAGQTTGLKANARRFRITLGQRAVDDGKDKYTVAELLDHSDTQSVGAYYEASPAIVRRLDRSLAMELAPVAQAFAGVLIDIEAPLEASGTSNRIYDRSLRDNVDVALGNCGKMSFCGLAVPYACYTCRHFRPWRNGPHNQFMDALLADRARMSSEGLSPKIYAIRDRTILAVAQVIRRCAGKEDSDD